MFRPNAMCKIATTGTDNGCPLIIETDFDIAFNKFIAVGSS